MSANMLGPYGEWAAGLLPKGPGELSFRRTEFKSLVAWKRKAGGKLAELLAEPSIPGKLRVKVEKRYTYDGLDIEELSWDLPHGRSTRAVFLKPQGAKGALPAILALHDHGGRKYFGVDKIVCLPGRRHPLLKEHQQAYYGDKGWANEIARRGYAVLVHDAFLFGSRRIRYGDVGPELHRGRRERRPDSLAEVQAYNEWAGEQESVVASSLFCAGTTWPGAFLAEDRKALDYLCNRKDVDPERVGCGGLSGGGLRTVFLGGTDPRIKAAVCAGFMSTWRDFLLYKSFTHTWMMYAPLAPRYFEFGEMLGLRVPLPTMVLNCNEDSLFTLEEMHKADRALKGVYRKAKASGAYDCRFYPGGHKFDLEMQGDAFGFWDRWLKG